MCRIFVFVLFFLLTLSHTPVLNAQNSTRKYKEISNLKDVRNIFIDRMASNMRDSDFAESSCKTYREEQTRSRCYMTGAEVKNQRNAFFNGLSYIFEDYGFQLVSDFDKADAVMTMRVSVQKNCGGLTFSDFWKNRAAGFYVESIEANLKSFGGKSVWTATSPGKNSYREGTSWIADNLRTSKNKPPKPTQKTD